MEVEVCLVLMPIRHISRVLYSRGYVCIEVDIQLQLGTPIDAADEQHAKSRQHERILVEDIDEAADCQVCRPDEGYLLSLGIGFGPD